MKLWTGVIWKLPSKQIFHLNRSLLRWRRTDSRNERYQLTKHFFFLLTYIFFIICEELVFDEVFCKHIKNNERLWTKLSANIENNVRLSSEIPQHSLNEELVIEALSINPIQKNLEVPSHYWRHPNQIIV